MVRFLKAAAALLCAVGLSAFASTTAVTGTLTDQDGIVWANCTWSAILNSDYPPTIAGAPVPDASLRANGSCNSSGVLTATMLDVLSIQQHGATWTFTITPNASAGTSTISGVSVTGTSINLSTVLSAGLQEPRFSASPFAFGYADVEVNSSTLGGTYYNVGNTCSASGGLRQLSNTGWQCTTGSGGGGTGTLTNFSAGSLSPLFASNVSNPTTAPALTFTLSAAAQNSVFAGPATGGAAAPSFQTAPTFSAANLTNFPTFNQSTSGNAATATSAAKITSNGTANQVWGMNSGATAQGWITQTGGGGGSGTVTTVSVATANGISGTVANATTTPAITLSLGAITPTSVASTGAVSGTTLTAGTAAVGCPATGCIASTEAGTAGTPTATTDYFRASSATHQYLYSLNGGAEFVSLANFANVALGSQVAGTLPVANGGTGTTTPAIVAGTNVTVSGTWPNQTINASGGGGGSIAGIYSVNSGPTTNSTVSASVAVGVTTIPMVSTTGYVLGTTGTPAWYKVITGQFSAPVEMSCTGGTATSLTGCTRGLLGTTDAAFTSGMAVWELDKIFFGTSTTAVAPYQHFWNGISCIDCAGAGLNNTFTNGFAVEDSPAYVQRFGVPFKVSQVIPGNDIGVTTITPLAGAGTGATVALVGTNMAGTITLNTGTSPTASSVLFTVTFDSTLQAAPFGCQLYPRTANATGLLTYTTAPTTTTWTANVGTTALPASTTGITWSYQCI